jgi:hypothetical protein
LLAPAIAHATEIYRWVDENGVPNFSQNAPPAETTGVTQMILDDAAPPGHDPEVDIYHVQAQAERIQALRDEMAERRQARLERERTEARQHTARQPQPHTHARPVWWHPPLVPRPPVQPPPTVPEPHETRILLPPPGQPD